MSINIMAAISIEQYLSFKEGDRGRKKKLRVYVFISISWLLSIGWALPPLFGWSRYRPEVLPTSCSYDYTQRDEISQYFLLSVVICDLVIPVFVICLFHVLIFKLFIKHKTYLTKKKSRPVIQESGVARNDPSAKSHKPTLSEKISLTVTFEKKRHTKNSLGITSRSHQCKQKKDKYNKMQYQIVGSLCLMALVHCSSWAPYAVITLMAQYGNQKDILQAISAVAIIMAKSSTAFNPLILLVLHPPMKRVLRRWYSSSVIVSSWHTPTSPGDAV